MTPAEILVYNYRYQVINYARNNAINQVEWGYIIYPKSGEDLKKHTHSQAFRIKDILKQKSGALKDSRQASRGRRCYTEDFRDLVYYAYTSGAILPDNIANIDYPSRAVMASELLSAINNKSNA
ncbi:MAG: hypothetical protein Solumvirus8_5, partial [Solumvirus sp.]